MVDKVLLSQEVIQSDLSPKELGVYIALRSMYPLERTKPVYLNPNAVLLELSQHSDMNETIRRGIKQAIDGLDSKGLIQILDKSNRGDYSLNISKIYFDSKNEFFLWVDNKAIEKIMNAKLSSDRFALLKYYLVVLTSMDYIKRIKINGYEQNRIICTYSIGRLSSIANMQFKTITKYNKDLDDLKLIYTIREPLQNNIYCRYEHKDAVLKYFRDKVIKG